MYPVAILGVATLLPFAVNNFIQGRFWLGVAVLSAVVILGTDALAIHFRKPPPIPYVLMLVPMAVGMTLSLRTQGVIGALWSYPTILFFYFVLQGIVALVNRRTRVLDQLFRVGGDEFALLLPDTQESDAAILAEHLRRTVAESPLVDGQPPSVSIGVSELRGGESMDGWMRNAD